MAYELLARGIDNFHEDPIKDKRGSFKKGYFVNAYEPGGGTGNAIVPPDFIRIKITDEDVNVEDVKFLFLPYKQNFRFIVSNVDYSKDIHTIKIETENDNDAKELKIDIKQAKMETAIGDDGKQVKETKTKKSIQEFLEFWGIKIKSSGENFIEIEVLVFDTLKSEGFWEKPLKDISFSEKYNSKTGVHQVQIDYSKTTNSKSRIQEKIELNGGSFLSSKSGIITFEIDRDVFIEKLKEKIKGNEKSIYCRKYYLDHTDVDDIIKAGGEITMSHSQLMARVKNKGMNQ